jgi:putative flippase GtrA
VVQNLVRDYGLKMCRYCGVSLINVVVGQSLLLLFYKVIGWPAAIANVAAVCISAGPAYLLSRKWVWRQTGTHSVRDEIAPFWGMALLGLLLSTIMVSIADSRWESSLAVSVANLAAFGIVWVFKFVVLEKIMWKQPTIEVAAIEVERL